MEDRNRPALRRCHECGCSFETTRSNDKYCADCAEKALVRYFSRIRTSQQIGQVLRSGDDTD